MEQKSLPEETLNIGSTVLEEQSSASYAWWYQFVSMLSVALVILGIRGCVPASGDEYC